MTFQLPEDLSQLAPEELEVLQSEGLAEARAIAELSDDDLTDEQITAAETIMSGLATVAAELDSRIAAAEARNSRLAAIREQVTAPEEVVVDEPTEEAEIAEAEEEAPAEQEAVPVVAAARPASVPVSRVARRAPAVVIPEVVEAETGPSFVASANVPGFSAGADLGDFDGVVKAFESRVRNFASPKQGASSIRPMSDAAKNAFAIPSTAGRFSVARIQKPDNELTTGSDRPISEQMQVINDAANEKRLPKGGLVAAGGWCAPSETLYDFCSLETVSGILSIPEVSVSRGGINYTKGPDYAAIAANWGFIQTEAEAEAGTEKVCYEVECPPFQEIRLDAIGFCVTAGVLTNVGYPELIRRVLEIGAVAHAHAVNKYVISHIQTLLGTAVDYTEIGSATADVLDALSLSATRLRYQYSLAPEATLEVVLPVWAKEIIRADLSRRTGVDLLNVSDAQIQGYFSVRNLAVQWIYDYQPLPTTGATAGQAWPTTLEVMIYPAGAFVKGTTPVIDLDTIYDSVGLSTNTYTAAFFEEGIFVANTCGSGYRVSIDISCLAGVTGAAELTCITPAP